MKVDALGQLRTAPLRRRTGGTGDGSFARALQDTAGPGVGGGPIGSIDALLALQEVGDATVGGGGGRQQQEQHGHDLLDRLEELRWALLDGCVSRGLLQRIDQILAQRPAAGADPRIEALLDEIELRAAVELAKLERAAAVR